MASHPPELRALQDTLDLVLQSKSAISSSKIQSITRIAILHPQHYKHSVALICNFIKIAPSALKLSGLYIVDAVVRASLAEAKKRSSYNSGNGDPFSARFELVMPPLTTEIQKCSDKEKEKIKKLIDVWRANYVFRPDFLEKAESKWPGGSSSGGSGTSEDTPKVVDDTKSNVDTMSLIASLSSLTQPKPIVSGYPTAVAQVQDAHVHFLNVPAAVALMSKEVIDELNRRQRLLKLSLDTTPTTDKSTPVRSGTISTPPALSGAARLNAAPMMISNFPLPPPLSALPTAPPTSLINPSILAQLQQHMPGLSLPNFGNQITSTPQPPQPLFPTVPINTNFNSTRPPPSTQPPPWQSTAQNTPYPTSTNNSYDSSTPNNNNNSQNYEENFGERKRKFDEPQRFTAGNYGNNNNGPRHRPFNTGARPDRGNGGGGGGGGGGGNNNNNGGGGGNQPPQNYVDWTITPCDTSRHPSEWIQMPGGCGPSELKGFNFILSCVMNIGRTLYIGGITPDVTREFLYITFSAFGPVDSILLNPEKHNCFLKLRTRRATNTARQACRTIDLGHTQLRVNWGCGFGPKDIFDFNTGVSLIPIARLDATEQRWIMTCTYGGVREGVLRGGLTVEEPEVVIPGQNSSTVGLEYLLAEGHGGDTNNYEQYPTTVPSQSASYRPPQQYDQQRSAYNAHESDHAGHTTQASHVDEPSGVTNAANIPPQHFSNVTATQQPSADPTYNNQEWSGYDYQQYYGYDGYNPESAPAPNNSDGTQQQE